MQQLYLRPQSVLLDFCLNFRMLRRVRLWFDHGVVWSPWSPFQIGGKELSKLGEGVNKSVTVHHSRDLSRMYVTLRSSHMKLIGYSRRKMSFELGALSHPNSSLVTPSTIPNMNWSFALWVPSPWTWTNCHQNCRTYTLWTNTHLSRPDAKKGFSSFTHLWYLHERPNSFIFSWTN